jgi:hypothetical protein
MSTLPHWLFGDTGQGAEALENQDEPGPPREHLSALSRDIAALAGTVRLELDALAKQAAVARRETSAFVDEMRLRQGELSTAMGEARQELDRLTVATATLGPSAPQEAPFGSEDPKERGSAQLQAFRGGAPGTGSTPPISLPHSRTASGLLSSDDSESVQWTEQEVTLQHSDMVSPNLPLAWPTVLQIRGAEMGAMFRTNSEMFRRPVRMSTNTSNLSGSFDMDSSVCSKARGIFVHLIIDPNATSHAYWDMISFAVLLYDLIVTPYVLAWNVQTEGWLHATALGTALFWTLDLGLNFITGFFRDGEVERRPEAIVRHYLRTWFVPDVVVVSCDWLSLALTMGVGDDDGGGAGGLKMLRFAKLGRALRIISMLRMVKAIRIVEEFVEKHFSEFCRMALKLLAMVCLALWLSHLVGCVWFAIGNLHYSDTREHWISSEFTDRPLMYQYITAFHWSVAQVTLASIEPTGVNSIERAFAIVLLLLGLFVGSTLISSLSATMVELELASKDKTEKLRTLRQFIRENSLDRHMALLVQKQVVARLGKRDKLTDKDVPVLALLSSNLRTAVRFETFRQHLTTHPLFRLWAGLDMATTKRLCVDAMDFVFFRPKDDVFTAGSAADKAFFVVSSRLSYTQEPETSPVQERTETEVPQGRWLSEAALWAHWTHVGTAVAEGSCQLLAVAAERVFQAAQRYYLIRDITQEYCIHFHRRLVSSKPPSAPWPNDLQVPFTDYGDLVVSMTKPVQEAIGLQALLQAEAMAHRTWQLGRAPNTLEKLRGEVMTGKSTVVVNGQGEIERVVSVVALRIQQGDYCLEDQPLQLVEIGRWNGTRIVPTCQLPGGKQERDELVGDAARRLMDSLLEPIVNRVKLVNMKRQVEWKESKEYGVRTKYLRTVCVATLEGDLDVPTCQASSAAMPTSPLRRQSSHVFKKDANLLARHSRSRMDWFFRIWERWEKLFRRASMRHATGSPLSIESPSSPVSPKSVEVPRRPVYVVPGPKAVCFYAWFEQREFEQLRGPGGEATLDAWLATLVYHPERGDEHKHPEHGVPASADTDIGDTKGSAVTAATDAAKPGIWHHEAIGRTITV